MTRLEKLRKSLQVLDTRLERLNAEKKRLEREVTNLSYRREKDKEILQIYKAGKIFKEAGILDSYEHDGVLEALEFYRDWAIDRNNAK